VVATFRLTYGPKGPRLPSQTRGIVVWLLSGGHFKYGGVNVEVSSLSPPIPCIY
jgi:hypothetical protein